MVLCNSLHHLKFRLAHNSTTTTDCYFKLENVHTGVISRGFLTDEYRINLGIRDTSVLGDSAGFFLFFFNRWPIIM
jgi:hypothetical protein